MCLSPTTGTEQKLFDQAQEITSPFVCFACFAEYMYFDRSEKFILPFMPLYQFNLSAVAKQYKTGLCLKKERDLEIME